ncbi:MAG TPA: CaiB/BaiF CoA-transferase family protein [Candidatus Competibacteraceae bacterium]|nr:CaiB/BaiF CoA-transferase family protein [Candidatus Competibacteraceae bacterium]
MSRPAPLADLRVLDLSRLLPGPLATQHLADLGAEVIKIEDTGTGDYARGLGPRAPDGTAWLFHLCNRNKRSLRLDLKKPAGCELFLELAKGADVVVEGFRPGVMERLGVGYPTLRAVNPRLVYCAITGYGQSGPWRERAGHDLNYIAVSGVLEQIGAEGGPPAIPNLQIGDLLGGSLSAVMGILAAVIDARTHGTGRFVDVAMADCVLAHNLFPLIALLGGSSAARGADLLTGGYPCYAVYPTADGRYMAVAALEPKFWAECCRVLGHPELEPRQFDPAARAELAALFAHRSQAEWAALFAAADCCVTPVLSMTESLEHPQFRARGLIGEDAAGRLRPGFPLRFSDYACAERHPPPAPGADSAAILREAGYDEAAIERLAAQGVIGLAAG